MSYVESGTFSTFMRLTRGSTCCGKKKKKMVGAAAYSEDNTGQQKGMVSHMVDETGDVGIRTYRGVGTIYSGSTGILRKCYIYIYVCVVQEPLRVSVKATTPGCGEGDGLGAFPRRYGGKSLKLLSCGYEAPFWALVWNFANIHTAARQKLPR